MRRSERGGEEESERMRSERQEQVLASQDTDIGLVVTMVEGKGRGVKVSTANSQQLALHFCISFLYLLK